MSKVNELTKEQALKLLDTINADRKILILFQPPKQLKILVKKS